MHQDEPAAITDAPLNFAPYTLGARLDGGDGAHTYLAKNASGEPVVLKLFRGERAGSRFINESAYQFVHPNIARILDIGRVGGHGYIVREFVDGVDLSKLAEAPPGREKSALIYDAMRQLTEICIYLSGQRDLNVGYDGIEHNQIVAKNVLLGVDGRVRLINFDRAATVMSEERAKTRTQCVLLRQSSRSPAYDLVPDQEGLPVLLYQLFSGHAPPQGSAQLLSGPFGVLPSLREALERTDSPEILRRKMLKALEGEGLEIQPEQVRAFVASLDGYRDLRALLAQLG